MPHPAQIPIGIIIKKPLSEKIYIPLCGQPVHFIIRKNRRVRTGFTVKAPVTYNLSMVAFHTFHSQEYLKWEFQCNSYSHKISKNKCI